MSLQEAINRQYRGICDQVIKILEDPSLDRDSEEFEPVFTFIKSIDYFKKILEAPIKYNDFTEAIKHRINLEVNPQGTVLLQETDSTDKFWFILRGNVQKWQQRSYEDVEKEFRQKNPKTVPVELRRKEQELTNEYYSTANTQKTPSTNKKIFKHAKTIGQLIDTHVEGERSELIHAYPEILGNIDEYSPKNRRGATKIDLGQIVVSNGFIEDRNGLGNEGFNQVASLSSISSREDLTPRTPRSRGKMTGFQRSASNNGKALGRAQTMKSSMTKIEKKATTEILDQESPEKILPVTQEDLDLLTIIAYENPLLQKRCYVGNVLRINKVGSYSQGEHLGDNFEKPIQVRENCIAVVSSEEAYLLTITKDDYKTLRAELFKEISKRAQVFCDIFTSFSDSLGEKFSHYFSSKTYKKNELIYSQGDQTEDLYLLQFGDVKLTREVDVSSSTQGTNNVPIISSKTSRKTELAIAGIIPNQFFGEEWLLRSSQRQFTAVSKAAETVVYYVPIDVLKTLPETFDKFIKLLTDQAQERFVWRQQRAQELLDQQKTKVSKLNLTPFLANIPKANSSPNIRLTARRGENMAGKLKDKAVLIRDSDTNFCDRNRGWEPRIAESPVSKEEEQVQNKNSEIYKTRFTRKITVMPPSPLDSKIIIKNELFSARGKAPSSIEDLMGFNVRRELEDSRPQRTTRLPKVSFSSNVSPIRAERGSASNNASPMRAETPRSLQIRITKLAPSPSPLLRSPDHEKDKAVNPFILTDFHGKKQRSGIKPSAKPRPLLRSTSYANNDAVFKAIMDRGLNITPINDSTLTQSHRLIADEDKLKKSGLMRNVVK